MISSYRFLQQYSSRYLVFIPERSFGYCNNKQLEIEPPFTMSDSPSHTPSLSDITGILRVSSTYSLLPGYWYVLRTSRYRCSIAVCLVCSTAVVCEIPTPSPKTKPSLWQALISAEAVPLQLPSPVSTGQQWPSSKSYILPVRQ